MPEPEAVVAGPLPTGLVRELEDLGLSPYEARVLLALLRLGSANTAQLGRYSGVPRTSTYQVLEELNRRGLAQRMSVEGPAVWASPGRDEVFDRLDADQEARLREHRARTARVREQLAQSFPETQAGAGPYVHVVQGAGQASSMYDRIVGRAEDELLVFNRPPYSQGADQVNPVVLEMLARGVRARALYAEEQWEAPGATAFRRAMAGYHDAGVAGALTEQLPMKLAVVDRKVALLAMTDPVLPDIGFPTTLLVEHPGFAGLQAEGFERLWEQAQPL